MAVIANLMKIASALIGHLAMKKATKTEKVSLCIAEEV